MRLDEYQQQRVLRTESGRTENGPEVKRVDFCRTTLVELIAVLVWMKFRRIKESYTVIITRHTAVDRLFHIRFKNNIVSFIVSRHFSVSTNTKMREITEITEMAKRRIIKSISGDGFW